MKNKNRWINKMLLSNSPIQKINFQNRDFLIKRDDLLNQDFSGNKARKFHFFLHHQFPNIDTVISYGSNQSNAMYSLSVLAKLKGWKFIFYTNHLSTFLQKNPIGNYKYALLNGMEMRIKDEIFFKKDFGSNSVFIEEGGRQKEAEFGIKILANEIIDYAKKQKIDDLNIFLPSGTGATALFLQKNLPFKVYTCNCVGDEDYLKKQFFELEKNQTYHPTILSLEKKYHFGKLYPQFYEIWNKLKKETDIEFDLLYDPKGWVTLLNSNLIKKSKKILYIHQGGIKGNESMILRYIRKISCK